MENKTENLFERHYSANAAAVIAVFVSSGRPDEEALRVAAAMSTHFHNRLVSDVGSGDEVLSVVHEALGR